MFGRVSWSHLPDPLLASAPFANQLTQTKPTMATTAEATPADVSVTVSSGAGAGAATTGATPATGAQQGNA